MRILFSKLRFVWQKLFHVSRLNIFVIKWLEVQRAFKPLSWSSFALVFQINFPRSDTLKPTTNYLEPSLYFIIIFIEFHVLTLSWHIKLQRDSTAAFSRSLCLCSNLKAVIAKAWLIILFIFFASFLLPQHQIVYSLVNSKIDLRERKKWRKKQGNKCDIS